MLSIGMGCEFVAASVLSDEVNGNAELGERMAFDCLSGDEAIECLRAKGFQCAAIGEASRNSYSCYVFVENGCYRTRFQINKSGWSTNDRWVDGECIDSHEPVLEAGVRWRYDNTNAPDKLVFKLLVSGIFSATLDIYENLEVLDTKTYHPSYQYVEAGLTGKMGPGDAVRYFAERYLAIEKEVEDLSKRLLCDGKNPRYTGAENFYVLNQLDDVQLHVYEHHLFLARADLQASGVFDLDKAIREFPGGFSSTSIDHEVARDGSVVKVFEAASKLCEESWGHSFTVSGPITDEPIQLTR